MEHKEYVVFFRRENDDIVSTWTKNSNNVFSTSSSHMPVVG